MENKKNLDHLSPLFGPPTTAQASLQHVPGPVQHMIAEFAAHNDPQTAAQLSGVNHATNARYGEARGPARAAHEASKEQKDAEKGLKRTGKKASLAQHANKYFQRKSAAETKKKANLDKVEDLYATPFHGMYDDHDDHDEDGGGIVT